MKYFLLGPFDKNLGRTTVCEDDATCVVLNSADAPIPGTAISSMFSDNADIDQSLAALVTFRTSLVAANFTVLTN